MELKCRLCANVDPEIPPPITKQSYSSSSLFVACSRGLLGREVLEELIGGANALVVEIMTDRLLSSSSSKVVAIVV